MIRLQDELKKAGVTEIIPPQITKDYVIENDTLLPYVCFFNSIGTTNFKRIVIPARSTLRIQLTDAQVEKIKTLQEKGIKVANAQ